MAKLYFNYSTMNAGKSTVLLQASHNYIERGMQTYLIIAQFDKRAGEGRIGSRIGIGADADTFGMTEDLYAKIKARLDAGPCACIFIDEAQFLSETQVWQLARAVDDLGVPIMCFGLSGRFSGQVVSRLCRPSRPVRRDARNPHNLPLREKGDDGGAQGCGWHCADTGDQVAVGGNERYVSLCRRHWREAVGDTA